MNAQTSMDRRARILASMIKHRIEVVAAAIRPDGAPVPFSEQQTNEEALAWWRKNRYTVIGQNVLAGWQPHQVMQLDAWLGRNPDPSVGGGTP